MKLLLFILLVVVASLVIAVTLAGAVAMIRSIHPQNSGSGKRERDFGREVEAR